MKYIKIQSKGIIDPQAFSLIGASSKRDDKTKIGFFGSGLKYSLAYLLRNKIEFKVFSDFKEHCFTTETAPFREKEFDVIVVDGEKTSLTTQMGMDWEPWFIVREIYCNALDEGDSKISRSSKEPKPIQDSTVFYLNEEPFKEIVDNWGAYFSEGRDDNELLYNKDGLKIYTGGPAQIIYRKGIRVHHIEVPCVFHYDIDNIKINESRTIKDEFSFKYDLVQMIGKIDESHVITTLLMTINDNNTMEESLYWEYVTSYNESWLTAINGKTLVPSENAGFWSDVIAEFPNDYLILPQKMVVSLKKYFSELVKVIGEETGSDSGDTRPVQKNKRMEGMLGQSLQFLKEVGYKVDYPIEIVSFQRNETLGQAVNDKILLSTKVFDKGLKLLTRAIIEENEHHLSGFGDKTREFQNHIFERWVSTMEEKVNQYL